jgi:hypothetical protein
VAIAVAPVTLRIKPDRRRTHIDMPAGRDRRRRIGPVR